MSRVNVPMFLAGVALTLPCATGFGGLGSIVHDTHSVITPFLSHHASSSVHIASSAAAAPPNFLATVGKETGHLLQQYKHSLATNPLPTKMVTGGTLAVMGDAIAQSRDVDEEYDSRRALSFMSFDMCYRAGQHVAFPLIVEQCRGQYLGGLLSALAPLAHMMHVAGSDATNYLAAMEQTLASQLGIVPFLYYPVFFTLTALVQGLSAEAGVERAKENFLPLMKRNLLFWIPVQFIQFGFVEEGLQIPFLSICGLAWTFILSVMAGSTKTYTEDGKEEFVNSGVNGVEVDSEVESKVLFSVQMEEDVDNLGKVTQEGMERLVKQQEEKEKEKEAMLMK